MSEDWTGHVIVCGLHGEGLRTIEQLHLAGVRVVIVDDRPDSRLVRIVQGWGIRHLERDSRMPESLRAAGLAGAVALICVESDDLHTLETALLARELRPDARVVVQLRNPAVGRAIVATGVAVLDVAGLSAPSLVEACLRTGTHDVDIAGQRFVAVTVRSTARGTLRAVYGDLAPVAVSPVDGELVVCPGRDHRVIPGDAVTVLGTLEELRAARVLAPAEVPQLLVGARYGGGRRTDESRDRAGLGVLGSLRHVVRSVFNAADRRIWAVLIALLTLVIVSTTVLRLGFRQPGGPGMTIVDALYFTVETIGTVGYGDFYFRGQDTWLRLFAIGFMIVGAIMATAFFALLTNILVSRRLEESLGRLRVTRLARHVIVIGLGSIGIRVVELLVRQGIQVVVIEADENNRYLAQARALGVPVVAGDATQAEVLDSVHLSHARAVAVLTSDDLVNIETGLAVLDQLDQLERQGEQAEQTEKSGEFPLVLRLFDRRLAQTVGSSFGFSSVRSTAALAAPWFVGAALGLEVLSTFYVADTPMLVASLRITAEGGLDGLAMRELSARTRVVALASPGGELQHPPRRDTRFAADDVAYLVGTYEALLHVLRRDADSAATAPTAPTAEP